MASASDTRDRKLDRADYVLALAVLAVYAGADMVVLPALAPADWDFNISAQSLFVSCFQAAIALGIAFPLADALLSRQRYGTFTALAIGLLAASSALLEFVLEPTFFGAPAFAAAGYISMVEGGTIALLLTAARLLTNRQRNERRLAELKKAKTEAELQYLKGQINPHVLFNALNNIYSHALHKSDKTPDLILKLADMLRYMIYDCADDEVALRREISFLSDYVDIQKLALDGRGAVIFQSHGAIEGKRIPPFLLIPFVENCFKHSVDTQADNVKIEIGVEATDERVRMTCSNTFDPTARKKPLKPDPGIGLPNVRRRLQLLFGDDFTLSAKAQGPEFHVDLSLPAHAN